MPRVMVGIDPEVHGKFKQMSEVTGKPMSAVMNEALQDWYDTVGEARMERIQEIVAEGRAILNTSATVLKFADTVIEESKRLTAHA